MRAASSCAAGPGVEVLLVQLREQVELFALRLAVEVRRAAEVEDRIAGRAEQRALDTRRT